MADFISVRKDTGEEVMLNRDQVTYAESQDEQFTRVMFTNGEHLLIRESLQVLKSRP